MVVRRRPFPRSITSTITKTSLGLSNFERNMISQIDAILVEITGFHALICIDIDLKH